MNNGAEVVTPGTGGNPLESHDVMPKIIPGVNFVSETTVIVFGSDDEPLKAVNHQEVVFNGSVDARRSLARSYFNQLKFSALGKEVSEFQNPYSVTDEGFVKFENSLTEGKGEKSLQNQFFAEPFTFNLGPDGSVASINVRYKDVRYIIGLDRNVLYMDLEREFIREEKLADTIVSFSEFSGVKNPWLSPSPKSLKIGFGIADQGSDSQKKSSVFIPVYNGGESVDGDAKMAKTVASQALEILRQSTINTTTINGFAPAGDFYREKSCDAAPCLRNSKTGEVLPVYVGLEGAPRGIAIDNPDTEKDFLIDMLGRSVSLFSKE